MHICLKQGSRNTQDAGAAAGYAHRGCRDHLVREMCHDMFDVVKLYIWGVNELMVHTTWEAAGGWEGSHMLAH